MRVLQWGARKARLWLGELPTWEYNIAEVVERTREAPSGAPSLHCTAIELWMLIGARAYYGGVAVTYTPTQQGKLVVQVPVSPNDGVPFEESLAGMKVEEPFKGLPREYVPGLFEGLMEASQTLSLGSGTLRVCGAVHGRVGSSNWMFSMLGRIIVKMLTLETIALSDLAFIQLIQEEIHW